MKDVSTQPITPHKEWIAHPIVEGKGLPQSGLVKSVASLFATRTMKRRYIHESS